MIGIYVFRHLKFDKSEELSQDKYTYEHIEKENFNFSN